MADAKIITYGEPFSATTDVIPDGQTAALDIESSDGKDYVQLDTSNEQIILGQATKITGPGGTTGLAIPATNCALLVENSTGGGAGSCTIDINGDGGSGAQVRFREADTEYCSIVGTNDNLLLKTESNLPIKINPNGSGYLQLGTATTKLVSGGETSALCAAGGLHLKIADSGLAAPNGSFDDLVIEHSGATGLTFSAPANSGIRFQKDGNTDHHGITFDSGTSSIRTRLGGTDRFYIDDAGRCKFLQTGVQYHAGTGNDDAATEPLYLTGSGANLIIDCRKGNYGDVTLTANVTAVKFLYRPDDGSVFTMTAKIKQGSSVHEIDYSDSAVTVYAGDGTGSASTGEMKWSGGVPHTIGAVNTIDIVQFTIFPNGTTFDVFAAVIGQDFS